MSMSMVYLLACLIIASGSFCATFFFAKKDWSGYAVFFSLIGLSAFGAATNLVLKEAPHTAPAQEQVEAK